MSLVSFPAGILVADKGPVVISLLLALVLLAFTF